MPEQGLVTLDLPFDTARGDFGFVELHARMMMRQPDGQLLPVPMENNVEFSAEPAGVLDIRRAVGQDVVVALNASLLDSAYQRPDLEKLLDSPFKVTIKGRPLNSSPQAAPIVQHCLVRVLRPKIAIHWQADDDPSTRNQAVSLAADGESEFTLQVWVAHFDIRTRTYYDEPYSDPGHPEAQRYEFTHWSEEGLPADVLAHVGPKPTADVAAGSTRYETHWGSRRALPDKEFPRLPKSTHVRVRAWEKGKVVRWDGGAAGRDGGTIQVEQKVPVLLVEPKIAVEVVEPEMPIPADGRTVTVCLRLTNEENGKPVKNATITLQSQAASNKGPAGKFEQPEGVTDEDGETSFSYTTPDLYYKPGGVFQEALTVFSGAATNRREVGAIRLLLAPSVKFKLEAEKPGLAFEPTEVLIAAEDVAASVTGTLELEAINPTDSSSKKFPVFKAKVKVTLLGGDKEIPLSSPIETDKEGAFVWKLPELSEVAGKDSEYELQADWDDLPEADLDEKSEEQITLYEDLLKQACPFRLYDDGLNTDLRSYRLVFSEQLATEDTTVKLEKIKSACHLLLTASTHTRSFERLYDNQMQYLKGDLGNFFSDVFTMVINLKSFGERFAGATGKLVNWIDDNASPYVRRFIAWVSEEFAVVIRKTSLKIGEMLKALEPTLEAALGGIFRTARATLDSVIQMVNEMLIVAYQPAENQLFVLLKGVVSVIGRALHALGSALWALVVWCTRELLRVLGPLCDQFADMVGFSPEVFDQVEKFLQERLRRSFVEDPHKYGKWTLGKYVEYFVGQWTAALSNYAGGNWSEFLRTMSPIAFIANRTVRWVYDRAKALNVPVDHDARVQKHDDYIIALREKQYRYERGSAFVDEIMAYADAILLGIECVAMLIATICSMGGAATLMAFFTKLDIAMSKIRALYVRVPQCMLDMLGGFHIAIVCSLKTTDLVAE